MKKLLLFAAAATMFAACSKDKTEDINVLPENVPPHDVLQVSVGDEDESRIQLDNGKTVWTQGDKVSVFYKTTGNECYQFIGNTGDTRGSIMKVSGSAGATAIDKNIVIYPYNKDYELDLMNNTVSVVIPSTQHYAKNSYGVGANVMIASSSNNSFTLRNICGWLKLQFTGNAIINAIKIKGNNNEQLAGTAIANYEDFSTFLYGNLANSGDDIGGIILPPGEYAREITLDCGTGLMLSDVPTEFYIAVAPQTLSKGISITAECYGNTSKIEKSTGKFITIARNHIVPVANIDIKADPRQCILYTSSDGKIVTPYDSSAFGASIVSNTYENGIGTIIFGKNITFIGKSAFQDCKSLTSVTIPNSVTSIGNSAFAGCNRLTAFHGKYASGDNRCLVQNGKLIAFAPAGLTEYTIPNSVTSIGNSAFYYCSNLTSITIPNSITGIESSAFKGCAGECIINCNIPDGSYNYNSGFYYAFKDSNFTKITIGNNVTSIGNYAFYNCTSLTSVTIGSSVTSIGNYAFRYCNNLTSATIGNSVNKIGDYAFEDCSSLTNITIPYRVTAIGNYAFKGCTGECIINCNIPNGSYNRNSSSYCDSAFKDSDFTKITIGNSVKFIGVYAFVGCRNLTSVTIGNNVTTIGGAAFKDCSSLTSINIPDGITSIGSTAFCRCSSLTSITIPNSVTSIEECAFEDCSSLTSINIPDNVTSIEKFAFRGCSSLIAFYGKYTSADNRYLVQNGKLVAFAPYGLTEYVIPNNVTSIEEYAFYKCSSLTSITIPDSVTSIGNSAFEYCSSLTSITIPDSVTSIGNSAFEYCSSLNSVYITDIAKWNEINSISLSNAYNLYLNGELVTDLLIPDSVTSIRDYAFEYCSSLTSITIPDSVTSIGNSAFRDCSNLTSITISNSVTAIGGYAFYNCSNLKNIYCKPTIPPTLGYIAFYNMSSTTKIYVPRKSVNAYKSASGWSSYASKIVGHDF